jgi:hypothetical protein
MILNIDRYKERNLVVTKRSLAALNQRSELAEMSASGMLWRMWHNPRLHVKRFYDVPGSNTFFSLHDACRNEGRFKRRRFLLHHAGTIVKGLSASGLSFLKKPPDTSKQLAG